MFPVVSCSQATPYPRTGRERQRVANPIIEFERRGKYGEDTEYSPKEPCTAVPISPVLPPCAEVVTTGETLPAASPSRHAVVLAEEQCLGLWPVPVAEVREVDVAWTSNKVEFRNNISELHTHMQTHTLPGVTY
jgi:hypothetical protein